MGGRDLRLDAVTKTFGSYVAVDEVSLTVPSGSFFALLGPSGCGKTTTLRIVAGLEQPTRGRVLLGDQDVTGTRPYRRPVNTVFQSYALFPHLDVFENVAFGLRRRRTGEVRQRVTEALDLVELGHLAKRKPGQLSGGQQQRVALARAVVNRPDVLLLDEPLGALDLKLRRQMQLELKRIQDEVGITFVHVTHDQEEAMTMADTIAVMHAGRIEQLGSPVELYESPASAYVANFLGQSNLLPGTVLERSGGTVVIEAAGARLTLPAERCRPSDRRPAGAGRGPAGEGAPVRRRPATGHRRAGRRGDRRRQLHRGEHPVPGAAAVRAPAHRVRAEHRVAGCCRWGSGSPPPGSRRTPSAWTATRTRRPGWRPWTASRWPGPEPPPRRRWPPPRPGSPPPRAHPDRPRRAGAAGGLACRAEFLDDPAAAAFRPERRSLRLLGLERTLGDPVDWAPADAAPALAVGAELLPLDARGPGLGAGPPLGRRLAGPRPPRRRGRRAGIPSPSPSGSCGGRG